MTQIPVQTLRRRIGMVFQTAALFEGTVLDNVLYGPRLQGAQLGGGFASELLERVGLPREFAAKPVAELSGGEAQRVSLARALANRPEVLLLDEPTASLDPTASAQVERLLLQLATETELTFLFVTHNLDQARRVGDRGLLLVDGRVVEQGPLAAILADPETEAMRLFIEGRLTGDAFAERLPERRGSEPRSPAGAGAVSFAPAVAGSHFSFGNVAVAVVMVAVAVGLSRWRRLDLERDIVVASVRAFVQLMAIGYVIDLIFRSRSALAVLAMLAAMIGFAAFTSAQRLKGLPRRFWIALAAIGLSSIATLGLMVALGIISRDARYLIPIGGMVIGNSMNVASVTGVRLMEDTRTQRALIETALALGASPRQAAQSVLRRAVRLALIPTIDSTKTMGIVFLPGAMTGMIIAGAKPLDAVRLQVVIMYMLLTAVAVTAVTVGLLVVGSLFTAEQQVRRLAETVEA